MNQFFKYFQFNTAERKGFIVLTILILIINICVFVLSHLKSSDKIIHQLYSFNSTHQVEEVSTNFYHESRNERILDKISLIADKIEYFNFDPNTLSADGWSKLGVSDKQSRVILNYILKGGKFYKKEDLKKIYSISERDYLRLAPYIHIKESRSPQPIHSNDIKTIKSDNNYAKKDYRMDINSSDTSKIKQLYGIGSVLALRIVKFRDALGGFYAVEQIKEVYGLNEETYIQIKDKLIIDTHNIQKLAINSLDAMALDKHPYITKKQAQAIVNYRQQHGNYEDISQLKQNKALDQEFLRKIEPYLEF